MVLHTQIYETGINSPVGNAGESYDSAVVESTNSLYKAEVIHKDEPWHGLDNVERETLTWADWFNIQRILEPSYFLQRSQRMKQKLTHVMMGHDSDKKLSELIELGNACLGRERTGRKRDHGAAGKTPF